MDIAVRICVIFNPVAQGDKARRHHRDLEGLASAATLRPTTAPGTAAGLAAQAVREGFEVVVGAGGDGTVNEVLNGLAEEPGALARVALGVWPLGTANVFARELGIPLEPRRAWEIIAAGRRRAVDVVRGEFHRDGRRDHRWFVQVGGAGMDARACELVDWRWKKRFGFLAYAKAGFDALREPQPIIRAVAGDRAATGELVLMGNGRHYGGGFKLFPQADLRNGLLAVRVFPRVRWRSAAGIVLRIGLGRPAGAGGSTDFSAGALELTASRRVPLQLDGEVAGELPARFAVSPGALQVLAP